MNLIPYLSFAGNCEQALNRYKEIFRGEIVFLQRFKDAPGMEISPDYQEKIMHAQFKFGDQIIYLSDVFEGEPVPDQSRILLNLNFDTKEEQKRVYDELKKDGQIKMKLEETFWNAIYGSVVDEFGIPWGLDFELEEA